MMRVSQAFVSAASIFCLVLMARPTHAATFTWSCAADEVSPFWSNPKVWTVTGTDTDGLPDGDDVVIFDGTSAVGATLDQDFSVSQLTILSTYGGVVRFSSGVRLTTTTTSTTANALEVEGASKLEALGGIVRVSGGIIDSLASLGTLELAAATTTDVKLARDLEVFGKLVVTGLRNLDVVSGSPRIRVNGDVETNDADMNGNVFVSLVGATDQTLSGTGRLRNLDVSKPSGKVRVPTSVKLMGQLTGDELAVIEGEINLTISGTFNYRGTLQTLRLSVQADVNLNWHLRLTDLVIDDADTFAGTSTYRIEVLGDVTINEPTIFQSAIPISFIGAGYDQRIRGTGRIGWLDVAKPSGKLIIDTPSGSVIVYTKLTGNAQAVIEGEVRMTVGTSVDYPGWLERLYVNMASAIQLERDLHVGELVVINILKFESRGTTTVDLVRVDGNVTIDDVDYQGTALISLCGSGAQHVGGLGRLPKLDISKSAGAVTIADRFANQFTALSAGYVSRSYTPSTARWEMRGASLTATATTIYQKGLLTGELTLTGPITVKNGGTLAPDRNLTINGNLTMESGGRLAIDGLSGVPGTTSDKVVVNGTVSVSNASLLGTSGGVPSRRVVFIENDGTDLVTTRFSGAASNPSSVTIDGQSYFLHYTVGDGNDLAVYPPDTDDDGIGNAVDNCVTNANPSQLDTDRDLAGDACDLDDDGDAVLDVGDLCPLEPGGELDVDGDGCPDEVSATDTDLDGLPDATDNCPEVANADQLDTDGDEIGDACDAAMPIDECPDDPHKTAAGVCGCGTPDNDGDGDGVLDCQDACPSDALKLTPGACGCGQPDTDGDTDGRADCKDNCPLLANGDQADLDSDGAGDACDPDDDGDGVPDAGDNCPLVANADQSDIDGTGGGDACDPDDDGDGLPDAADNCPTVANADQTNTDGDALGDECDTDDDNDAVPDTSDDCPLVSNFDQVASDADGRGDACDDDDDDDGVPDQDDNCPIVANPAHADSPQADTDSDGDGDACDGDDDGDAFADASDNCPLVLNPEQENNDGDFGGDACDVDDDNDGVQDDADNCPFVHQVDQLDSDADGNGDACDGDDDGDGLADDDDNCPLQPNADQSDTDGDHVGDACDADDDGDGEPDLEDNCPTIPNPADPVQADLDDDGFGDPCDADDDGDEADDAIDNCLGLANGDQTDTDLDGSGDACDQDDDQDGVGDGDDVCPLTSDPAQAAHDGDGLGDACDADDDGDGVDDGGDNCPVGHNPEQADADGDGAGDACDTDDDGDGALDEADNCPLLVNADQTDHDRDGAGDACDDDDDDDRCPDAQDNCPRAANADQSDLDGDALGDACDPDLDGDGVANMIDNCPGAENADQADGDADGSGDACDGDTDGDGAGNALDNCPLTANDQGDLDGDGVGDACDADLDGDGLANTDDTCALVPDPEQGDLDQDGSGDACDPDDDGDAIGDAQDDCPAVANADQNDADGDGSGDACDPDDDGDGAYDEVDNCPRLANASQVDSDRDGRGNECDDDDDGDGVPDGDDNCPTIANADQGDGDGDAQGDACDGDGDHDGVPDGLDQCPGTARDAPLSPYTVAGYVGVTSDRTGRDFDEDGRYAEDHVRGEGADDLAFDPATGCALDQLCPCSGPRGTDLAWKSHGAFVSCVTQTANGFYKRRVISEFQRSALVVAAAQSECGLNACAGRPLKSQSADTAPYLVVTIDTHRRWGQVAPSGPVVYAGTTRVMPDATGAFVIPLVIGASVVRDDVLPVEVDGSAIPSGAFFVLRQGDGRLVLGHKGDATVGARATMDVSVRVVGGQGGGERNLSFEGHGNAFAILGLDAEDELARRGNDLRLVTTVTRTSDLMAYQVCR